MTRRFHSLVVSLVAMTANPQPSTARLADRLVLEIEKTSYTQRQFELYVAMKGVVVEGLVRPILTSAANYRDQLESFTSDMLVEHEAHRLGSVQPERKAILAARDRWDFAVEKDPTVMNFAKRLGADPETVRSVAGSVLRVRGFVLSKERQSSQGSKEVFKPGTLDPHADWFVRLEQRTAYRIFEGARDYQIIQPAG